MDSTQRYDAVIIGGGFYGCVIACYLARHHAMHKIRLLENTSKLLSRASCNNQARVHSGYHYPRSFTTAYRSRINAPAFARDWPEAIKSDFIKLYAIARRNSKVTAKQFERFCHEVGAELDPVDQSTRALFEPRLIEAVYQVSEYAFNSTALASWATEKLRQSDIQISFDSTATAIHRGRDQLLKTTFVSKQKTLKCWSSYVFNCSYSRLNQLAGEFPGTASKLRHEVTEMALVKAPATLENYGITVMDGPFFSFMPFPARQLHSLSHVRYTPHLSWQDTAGTDPLEKLRNYPRETRVDRMLRDVSRYLPAIAEAKRVDSLFEVKTVLVKNESDDGRPILFEKHQELPGCYSILGGKIDNIYDILQKIDTELAVRS